MEEKKTKVKNRAQTATELAVFGAILLFVIGLIVRQGLSFGHIQNQSLRALRIAMKMSYEHSAGFKSGTFQNDRFVGNSSRNFANVLLIEDRLSSDSAKYGALSRNPVIANAQAAHSRNLFMPIDSNEDYNLPMMDMFINGKHFPFTVADFKAMCLANSTTTCSNNGISFDVWIGDLAAPTGGHWEANCVRRDHPFFGSQWYYCARLFAISPNNRQNYSWCTSGNCCPCPFGSTQCTQYFTPCPGSYIQYTPNERFDLDIDGSSDVSGGSRSDFAWQWILVAAFNRDEQLRSDIPLILNMGEYVGMGQEEESDSRNVVLDVDRDLKEERIIRDTLYHNEAGVILGVTVMDQQDGDLDFSYNSSDYDEWLGCFTGCDQTPACHTNCVSQGFRPEPGLLKDVAMFTRVRPGTFLEIQEGQVCNPGGGGCVRSINRKDHIDIIQRVIQLSNDTGRFCNGTTPVPSGPPIWPDAPNPVEVCAADCFTPGNVSRICYDIDDLRVFVRSRVSDRFGHQWVTDTTADPYVNFNVPTP